MLGISAPSRSHQSNTLATTDQASFSAEFTGQSFFFYSNRRFVSLLSDQTNRKIFRCTTKEICAKNFKDYSMDIESIPFEIDQIASRGLRCRRKTIVFLPSDSRFFESAPKQVD